MPPLLGELLDTECISLWTLNKGRVTTWDDVTGKRWDPAHVCTQPGPACAVWCACGISFLSPATCSSDIPVLTFTLSTCRAERVGGAEYDVWHMWIDVWHMWLERNCFVMGGENAQLLISFSYHIHGSCTCLLESHFRDSENQYLSFSFLKGGVYYILFFSFSTE